jgi:hypothetical protein
LGKCFHIPSIIRKQRKAQHFNALYKTKIVLISCFIAFQLLFPFRYLCYPNELFWTEEGFRFSWRVMLMEKGYATFKVKDALTKKEITINSHFF